MLILWLIPIACLRSASFLPLARLGIETTFRIRLNVYVCVYYIVAAVVQYCKTEEKMREIVGERGYDKLTMTIKVEHIEKKNGMLCAKHNERAKGRQRMAKDITASVLMMVPVKCKRCHRIGTLLKTQQNIQSQVKNVWIFSRFFFLFSLSAIWFYEWGEIMVSVRAMKQLELECGNERE